MATGKKGKPKFRSKSQWAWAFATKQKFAKTWAHRTTGTKKGGTTQGKRRYNALPAKKKR